MICKRTVKKFCCEDISLIENYYKAINDNTKTWDCHHRLEVDENLSKKELISMNLYYHRPASELIFLTPFEHMSLHHKDKPLSEEAKANMREAWKKRLPPSEDTKAKMSESAKKRLPPSEDTRKKISESLREAWNRNRRLPPSEDTKAKISESMRESWKRRKEKSL